MEHLLANIGTILILSALIGAAGYFLRQPLILAYLAAGVIIGPLGFKLIDDPAFVQGLSSVGLVLMLFLMGLTLRTSRLSELGMGSFFIGILQSILTGAAAFGLGMWLQWDTLESIYLALALSFSSTAIVIKLLSDKHDIRSTYGQLSVNMLLAQNALVLITLLALAAFQKGAGVSDPWTFLEVFLKGAALLVIAFTLGKRFLSNLCNCASENSELLIILGASWCFILVLIAQWIGFSPEMGAFIAGLSLANISTTNEINNKIKSIRDFTVVFFCVSLGLGLTLPSLQQLWLPILVITAFVLLVKTFITTLLAGLCGYDRRTAFLSGLSLANISEFSLVIVALGYALGHISEQTTALITAVLMLTMLITSYTVGFNNAIYSGAKDYLKIFERKRRKTLQKTQKDLHDHIILFGCDDVGREILTQVVDFKDNYLGIDHDTHVVNELSAKGMKIIFGDATDEDLLDELNLGEAEMVISTFSNVEDNRYLLKYIQKLPMSSRPIMIGVADSARRGMEMFVNGFDYVISKPYLSAQHIRNINQQIYNLDNKPAAKEESSLPENLINLENKIYSEDDYARILHSLNDMRLKEVKMKFDARKKEKEFVKETQEPGK